MPAKRRHVHSHEPERTGPIKLRIVNWNVDWASPRSKRGRAIQRELRRRNPDFICLTEASADLLPSDGQIVESEADYGYRVSKRRKVLLWARHGFTTFTNVSPAGMPRGRFVAATIRDVNVIGVCIPWSRAHVSTGRRDRKPWEDHFAYLKALGEYIESLDRRAICVVGDFNQTVPRSRAPLAAYHALLEAQGDLDILTAECVADRPMIDHIAASRDVVLRSWTPLPLLSDHLGWLGELQHGGGYRRNRNQE